jgi:transposase InsO family protein
MERDIVKRKKFILNKKRIGFTGYRISKDFGFPKSTVYSWINKYQNCNIGDFHDNPTRVKMPVDLKTRKYVIRLRNKWNWGPVRIEKFIRLHNPKDIAPLGHNKIYDIFVEEGLNLPIDFVRKTWGTKRFERPYPNYLWQTDFKLLDNDNWSCTFLDDHSRFLPAGKEFDESPTTDIALEVFMIAGKKYGFPKQVLTDQGVQFYNTPVKGWKQEDSRFTKELKELGIKHIVASKRRPTTIGKIESFHRALKYEGRILNMNYRKFFNYWNKQRPHQALEYKYPKDIYLIDNK